MTERQQPSLAELLTSDPEIMSGMIVFRGTRVPVDALFGNLAGGLTVDEILDTFPTLDRHDVTAVLELMPDMIASLKAA